MSAVVSSRGEGVAGALHLQCLLCGHFSKSHAHLLAHTATAHPTQLDRTAVGRLGNMVVYQSTARLFHCTDCFYTTREFTKLYNHIISKHCVDGEKEGGGGGAEGEGGDAGSEGGEKAEDKTGEEKEEEEKEKEEEGEEEEGEKEFSLKQKGSNEEEKTGEEKENEEDKPLKRKRSSEGEEEEEGEGNDEDGGDRQPDSGKGEGEDGVLLFDGGGYRCLICGWRHKLKALGINHVVRRHDIPKAYAAQAVKRDANDPAAAPRSGLTNTTEEEEASLASSELLKEEIEATAKVVRFVKNRFVCLICGWKTKLKGFAISHVVRSHDVPRPYSCKECKRCFFLPSHLQQHVRAQHRPGRYACPFCCFRSHFLGGFRRHCSRCNAREEEQEGGEEGGSREREEEIQ